MQTRFTRWMRENGERIGSAAFELKMVSCPGRKAMGGRAGCAPSACRERLPASRLSEGQQEALSRVAGIQAIPPSFFPNRAIMGHSADSAGSGLMYKISDSAIGYKPFDCFYMRNLPAYVVIGWQCGSRPLAIYMVAIGALVKWRGNRARAGMGENEALDIGELVTA